jgi:hypothetical protein
MDKLLTRLEPDLIKISATGQEGLLRFFADARQVTRNLEALIRSIQDNPGSLLWGRGALPEYTPR